MTQRTGRGDSRQGPPVPPGVQQPSPPNGWRTEQPSQQAIPPGPMEYEDLGIPQSDETYIPDPKGFMATGSGDLVGGRPVTRVTAEDLEDLHYAYAGAAPMTVGRNGVAESSLDMPRPDPEDEEGMKLYAREMERRRETNARRIARDEAISRSKNAAADELLKGFNTSPQSGVLPPTVGPAAPSEFFPPEKPKAASPKSQEPIATFKNVAATANTARLLESLLARVAKARSDGDFKMASELMAIAQETLSSRTLKKFAPKKERHPALQKLLSNLGLEKIASVDIEWLGMKWKFAPRSQLLDWWVAGSMGEDGIEINYSMIAAGLIGLDEAPLYEVFNIPLFTTYQMMEEEDKPVQEISVPIYQKYCESCGSEIDLQVTSCPTCGANQDPFDVPVELRLKYAVYTKRLLQEKVGIGASDLKHLVGLLRTAQKDRQLDKEDIYPLTRLLKPLPKASAAEEEGGESAT